MIKAIETRYAGCKFRSRLEARWAVFFDHMRVPWEYEPEGYVIDGQPYLPDFRIGRSLWVEVKGAESELDKDLMTAAARELGELLVLGPIPRLTAGQGDLLWPYLFSWLDPMMIQIPKYLRVPSLMGRIKEVLRQHPGDRGVLLYGPDAEDTGVELLDETVDRSDELKVQLRALLGPHGIRDQFQLTVAGLSMWEFSHGLIPDSNLLPDEPWLIPQVGNAPLGRQAAAAYTAARSARFEHGQSGA